MEILISLGFTALTGAVAALWKFLSSRLTVLESRVAELEKENRALAADNAKLGAQIVVKDGTIETQEGLIQRLEAHGRTLVEQLRVAMQQLKAAQQHDDLRGLMSELLQQLRHGEALVLFVVPLSAMPQTVVALVPLLKWLVGPGSGIAAYHLIEWARQRWPRPRWRLARLLLHAPRYLRLLSLVVPALIAIAASGVLAWIEGRSAVNAMDMVTAMWLSNWLSQALHGRQLSPEERLSDAHEPH